MALRFRTEEEMRRVLKLKQPEPDSPAEPVPTPDKPRYVPSPHTAAAIRAMALVSQPVFPARDFSVLWVALVGFLCGLIVALLLVHR